jgi:hypothetical protein
MEADSKVKVNPLSQICIFPMRTWNRLSQNGMIDVHMANGCAGHSMAYVLSLGGFRFPAHPWTPLAVEH